MMIVQRFRFRRCGRGSGGDDGSIVEILFPATEDCVGRRKKITLFYDTAFVNIQ